MMFSGVSTWAGGRARFEERNPNTHNKTSNRPSTLTAYSFQLLASLI